LPTVAIAKTEKNKPLLMHNGFNYIIDRTLDTKIYWKCQYCRTLKCKGRIHINVNFTNILHETGTHNHPANAANTEVRLFQDKIRSCAMNTNENTQNIIDITLSGKFVQLSLNYIHETFHLYHRVERKILLGFTLICTDCVNCSGSKIHVFNTIFRCVSEKSKSSIQGVFL
jgi:hypothetical protein